jgi:hypothetical protein
MTLNAPRAVVDPRAARQRIAGATRSRHLTNRNPNPHHVAAEGETASDVSR